MQNINKIGEKAEVALSLRKYNLAIKLSEDILKQNPCSDFAYYIIAIAYLEMNKLQEAEKNIKLALTYAPNDEINIAVYSNILFLKKEYKSALAISDNALVINPQNYIAIFIRIASLKEMKEYKRAEELAKYALTIYPNSNNFHLELAEIYVETKRYEVAEKAFSEALRLDPNDPITINNLGAYYYNCKQENKKALELFENSLRINPNDKTIIENYNSCIQSIKCSSYTYNLDGDLSFGNICLYIILCLVYFIYGKGEPNIPLILGIIALIYYSIQTFFIDKLQK